MIYMLDWENNKIYSRKGINRIATEFYRQNFTKNYTGKTGWRESKDWGKTGEGERGDPRNNVRGSGRDGRKIKSRKI